MLALFLPAVPAPSQTVNFSKDVQPILAKNCRACHEGGAPPADLRLDSATGLLQGSVSGKVVIPGNARESLLLQRINGESGLRMPLNGKPLSSDEIATIRRWIEAGARIDAADQSSSSYTAKPKHWAYVKPVKAPLPQVLDATWARNPIDRFVLAKLEKEGLKPSPEASKETLIRRVSLDVTGLPPTPAEVDEFVNDMRTDAYERLVDRLLASPRYGERWATPWLDLARYGDSNGLRDDRQRVAWPYRDWVIRALNRNMPFDQFTIEQLAGDLLPNATLDQKIATGFVRSSTLQTEGGTDPEENNWNAQIDRTSTVGTTWLGSSIGCAQCHNHKYDPFTQNQFYQMVAFFNNVKFAPDTRNPSGLTNAFSYAKQFAEPALELPSPEQARQRDEINAELQTYQNTLNDSSPAFQNRQTAWERKLVELEHQWKPLHPARTVATQGSAMAAAADGSILASGNNPDSETYAIEAKSPLAEIKAIRIEALPDPSLPAGGPGRDFYGNFMVREVKIEAGSSGGQMEKVEIKEALTDSEPPVILGAQAKSKQLWMVDATTTGTRPRVRYQLLLIPARPLIVGNNGLLRITIVQKAEVSGVNLGRFRLSATAAADPKFLLNIPAELRPVLSIAREMRTPEQAQELTSHYRTVAEELAPVRRKIAELRTRIQDLHIPQALVMEEEPSVLKPSAYIRLRGAFMSKGDRVEADVPSFLGPLPAGAPPNRLGLAQWLVSRENPLTARVTVNHFWATLFGRGIVETTEDFGTQGFAPSHPELLDWLAVEFMDNGWNMKAVERLMLTSSTYRQSSAVTPALLEKDPDNAWLSRGPRFRVEAEMVRDIALVASGQLSSKMFGPPVKPLQPAGLWDGLVGGPESWQVSDGEDRYRRAIYTFIRRSVRYPSLTVFDAPSREFCTARRPRSDTPLQALTTLNDPAFFEAAQAMAKRILKEGGLSTILRATYGFRLATSRTPTARERDALLSQFSDDRRYFGDHLKEAESVSGKPDPELAAWTMFSNAVLNLDETLTKE
jgi:hypothetical protein